MCTVNPSQPSNLSVEVIYQSVNEKRKNNIRVADETTVTDYITDSDPRNVFCFIPNIIKKHDSNKMGFTNIIIQTLSRHTVQYVLSDVSNPHLKNKDLTVIVINRKLNTPLLEYVTAIYNFPVLGKLGQGDWKFRASLYPNKVIFTKNTDERF